MSLARSALLPALALAALACSHGSHRLGEPLPGALTRIYADSAKQVLAAAVLAIRDEGMSVQISDAEKGVVESRYVDIRSLKTSDPDRVYGDQERSVKFRFHVEPTFGGTKVYAEAVYQLLPGGGQSTEQMVPPEHGGRDVLNRMLDRIGDHLAQDRQKAASHPSP